MAEPMVSCGECVGENSFAPLIDSIRSHNSDRVALRTLGGDGQATRELTFGELRARMDACAAAIAASTDDGEVVLLAERSPPEFVWWFLGGLVAGRWILPAPPESTQQEIACLVAESGACCAMGTGARVIAERHGLRVVIPGAGSEPTRSGGGGVILRTSGTTGIPKLVQRPIASLDAVASNVRDAASLAEGDVVLSVIPAWHSYGVENVVLGPLAAGATVAFCDGFDPGLCERMLSSGGATVFPGVPMMFEALSRGSGTPDRPSLRLAYSAGSSLPHEIGAAFADRWGQAVGQLYGATDVGSVTFNDPGLPGFAPGPVGVAMRGVSVRILCEGTRAAAVGEEGQVAIRAPSMLSRYLGDHAMELIDGHLLMGDLGRMDGAGRLTITGMIKFLIDVGGMKVNPLEVEGVLREHPNVADCAVVPIRVSPTVSRVRAIVTARRGCSAPDPVEIRAWSSERLVGYKVPRVVDVRESLPRSATGKLLRRVLERV